MTGDGLGARPKQLHAAFYFFVSGNSFLNSDFNAPSGLGRFFPLLRDGCGRQRRVSSCAALARAGRLAARSSRLGAAAGSPRFRRARFFRCLVRRFFRRMQLQHRALHVPCEHQRQHVQRAPDRGVDRGAVVRAGLVQHVIGDRLAVAGVADADPEPPVIVRSRAAPRCRAIRCGRRCRRPASSSRHPARNRVRRAPPGSRRARS